MRDQIPEDWEIISDFPDYAVSNYGRVLNTITDLIKKPSLNQQGIPNVLLMRDKAQFRRSVAPLVAETFLDPPTRETFDTPINLDGDRLNCAMWNLDWRPRWFAMKFHAQFKRPTRYRAALQLVDTGEIFRNAREVAVRFGLLEHEVFHSAHNATPVFPTWQRFQVVV